MTDSFGREFAPRTKTVGEIPVDKYFTPHPAVRKQITANLSFKAHQWFYTSDTSWRASQAWGGTSVWFLSILMLTSTADNPEPWDFSKQPAADIVIINIGTNDQNSANNVSAPVYADALTKIIQGVHGKWPKAQVVVMSLWLGFYQSGNSYFPNAPQGFVKEVQELIARFNSKEYLNNPIVYDGVTKKSTRTGAKVKPFVHLFNTTGILQHNDIAPQWHPTDVGAIKVASHLLQFLKLTFGWELEATGPE